MKRTLTTLMLAFGLVSMFSATPASAQNHPANATIPFAFVVGHKTLPAGTYNVSEFSTNAALFVIRGDDTAVTQLSVPNDCRDCTPTLTFARHGNDWVLVKVMPPDGQTSYSLPSYANKNVKMRLAAMVSVNLK